MRRYAILLILSLLGFAAFSQAQALTVITQPQGQTNNLGESVIFTVEAGGIPPFTFQWTKDGQAMPDATNDSYSIQSTTLSNAGIYSVIVSDSETNVASSKVGLWVLPPPELFISFGDIWKYSMGGTNLGIDWRTNNYDDSSWPSGAGVFGVTTNYGSELPPIRTPLALSNDVPRKITTYYFRLQTYVSNSISTIIFTNLIDDGAVFYANGKEILRQNMPALPTQISFITTASSSVDASNKNFSVNVNVPSGPLLLAAEVHNSSGTSLDAVFGTTISSISAPVGPPSGPVSISGQPDPQTILEGDPAIFDPKVSGPSAVFQWYKDGSEINGETNLQLRIGAAHLADVGDYFLRVTNAFGAVFSDSVHLSVISSNLTTYSLVLLTNTWKYAITGVSGISWRDPLFDDASWSTGAAMLAYLSGGFPIPVKTHLPLGTSTTYLRTHFQLPYQPESILLVSSNLLADGAIFYLNGTEVSRYRLTNSVAQVSPGGGAVFERTNLPTGSLKPGDNVLAVELHPAAANGGRPAFAESLTALAKTNFPLNVLTQPSSGTVAEYATLRFAGDTFGSLPILYQWYHDDAPILGATNKSLSISNVHPRDSGGYYFVAINPAGTITSAVAQASVTADSTPPLLKNVTATSLRTVIVEFTKTMERTSALDPANYVFTPNVQIESIHSLDSNVVVIKIVGNLPEPLQLTVNNVHDMAVLGNPVPANSTMSVMFDLDPSQPGNPLTSVNTVFLIIFENHSWQQILGNTNAPYFNSLLPLASYASGYFSPPGLHPSPPNYLWLEAGTNFGISGVFGDGDPSDYNLTTHEHLTHQLDRAGIPWKSYQENITGTDCPTTGILPYAVRHNPVMYFSDVTSSFEYCTNHVRPYPELEADLAKNSVANLNYIKPNYTNDMHTGYVGSISEIKTGDNWLAAELPKILNSTAYSNNGAVFITWDEDDSGTPQDPIGMIVLSPLAKGGGYTTTNYYTHSSTLRTFQEIFGVRPFLGDAANSPSLADLFKLLSVSSVGRLPDGSTHLTLTNTVPDKTNLLQASGDLVNWSTISTNVSATNFLEILDSGIPASNRFYRAYQVP
jgi:hypothetical protein